MDGKVTWQGGMKFEGTTGSGFSMPLDADADVGGEASGARPLELMVVSLAGCTAMDVISILRKKRQDVVAFEVQVHAERATKHPKIFTSLKVEYIITGRNIKPDAVQRAIDLSAETYCPAQAMLKQIAPMELTFVINEPAD